MDRCSNPACWNLISTQSTRGVRISGVPYCSMECYQKHARDNERLTRMGSSFYMNSRKERQLQINLLTGDDCDCKQCTGDP